MICPNCGRRNSSGATFCSRCHQRLPLASKLNGNYRRTVIAEPRGGGGSGAIVFAIALVAGFIFLGGAAAIYLSNPPRTPDPTDVAFASGSPTLPPFVQTTPTPTPSPSPTFILLPSDSPSFSLLPTGSGSFFPTFPPSFGPPTPTPAPTVAPVVARFTWTTKGFKVTFVDQSKGNPTQWLWDFGDGSGTSTEQNPVHPYAADQYRSYTIKLIVTGPGGTSTRTKTITFSPPPTPTPTPSPTPQPTDTPPPPTPTAPPTPTTGSGNPAP